MSNNRKNILTRFSKFVLVISIIFSNFTNKHQVSANSELEQPDLIFEENGVEIDFDEVMSLLENSDLYYEDDFIENINLDNEIITNYSDIDYGWFPDSKDEFYYDDSYDIFISDDFAVYQEVDNWIPMYEKDAVYIDTDEYGVDWWVLEVENEDFVEPRNAVLNITVTQWSPSPNGNILTPAHTTNEVRVTSNTRWNIAGNVNWIGVSNVTPANMTGNGIFRLQVSQNTTASQRSGEIRITGGGITRSITVTQARANSLTLSRTTFASGVAANSITVGVQSNTTWQLQSDVNWITFSNITPTNRNGNGTFTANIATNISTSARQGIITVTGFGAPTRTILVTQPRATFSMDSGTWNVNSASHVMTVNVTSNSQWTVNSTATWLTISNITPTNQTGNGSFRINVATNNTTFNRSGTITVNVPGAANPTRTIQVTQTRATISLSHNSWTPSSNQTNLLVNVTATGTWNVHSNATWLTVDSRTSSTIPGNGSFWLVANANTTTASRSATITVSGPGANTQTINVTQPRATLTLSTSSWDILAPSNNLTVNVTSSGTWTVTSNVTWLTISNTTPNNRHGNGSFRINATTNTTTSSRTGTITVTAPGAPTRTISVTQSRANLTLSDTSWTLNAQSNHTTINVTSDVVWNVNSNVTWLTITNVTPANRNGNGSFRINASTNDSTSSRTGTITVTASGAQSRTITVTQSRATLNVSDTFWNPYAIQAITNTFFVESDVQWSVESSAYWLQVVRILPTNQTGNGEFGITLDANPTSSKRSATVTVSAQGVPSHSILVTQEGSTWNSDVNEVFFWNEHTLRVHIIEKENSPLDFFLVHHVQEAKRQWGEAIGMRFVHGTKENAHILVYGGPLLDIRDHASTVYRVPLTEWLGFARYPRMEFRANVLIRNQHRTVRRFIDGFDTYTRAVIFIGAQHFSGDDLSYDEVRKLTLHEFGHILGYRGHSLRSNDVMFGYITNQPNTKLTHEEITHLRQIYEYFRN